MRVTTGVMGITGRKSSGDAMNGTWTCEELAGTAVSKKGR